MAQPFIIVPPVIIDDVKLLLSDVPENDYAEWNAAVNYVKGDRVILVSTHTIYEAASANLNKNPATNKAIWLVVSATNRWKVFDDKTLSQTEQIESMSYTLLPGKGVNTVGLIRHAQRVTQHHCRRQYRCKRVGFALPRNIGRTAVDGLIQALLIHIERSRCWHCANLNLKVWCQQSTANQGSQNRK